MSEYIRLKQINVLDAFASRTSDGPVTKPDDGPIVCRALVRALQDGGRIRLGTRFVAAPTAVEVTEAQLSALRADPVLAVEDVERLPVEPTPVAPKAK